MARFIKNLTQAVAGLLTMCLLGCEPVSVSVSPHGEIAFTRLEGVFFLDSAETRIIPIHWSYHEKTAPALVQWSADGNRVAFTLKQDINSQETEIYVAEKGSEAKRLTIVEGIVANVRWSTNGKYLTYAKNGSDADLGVADIGCIDVANGMSKILVKNCSDLHFWVDSATIITVDVLSKVKEFEDRLIGAVTARQVSGDKKKVICKFVTTKKCAFDVTGSRDILISALSMNVSDKADSGLSAALYKLEKSQKPAKKIADASCTFVKYSPDCAHILAIVRKELTGEDMMGKEVADLEIITVKSGTRTVIRSAVPESISAGSNTIALYPAWFDANHVLFFNVFPNYGSSVESLALFKIDIITRKLRNLQPVIDKEIDRLVIEMGGY